jgi:hypothetical protein
MTWGEFKKMVDDTQKVTNDTPLEYIDFDSGLMSTGRFAFFVSVDKETEDSLHETLAIDMTRIGGVSEEKPVNDPILNSVDPSWADD